ncbi:MAG: DUF4082 domain-containing protein, partial [Candidatus Saccharimonadales bacterium]
PVAAVVSYSAADNSVTIDPSANLAAMVTYTIAVSQLVTDTNGIAMATDYTSSFTTGDNRVSLWAPTAQSVLADTGSDVEVGLRFSTSQPGTITKLHFYKTATDTSTSHTLNLWSETGVLIGSATTANETATGWQTATLATPIAVNASAIYTASYRASNGVYSYTSGGLSASVLNGPLTALAGGGVFSYGGGYPSQSFNNANYWVDVDFAATN